MRGLGAHGGGGVRGEEVSMAEVSRRGVLKGTLGAVAVAAVSAGVTGAERAKVAVEGAGGVEGARLFTLPGLLARAGEMLRGGEWAAMPALYGTSVATFGEDAKELTRRFRLEKPALGFAERSRLLDLTVRAGLVSAARGWEDPEAMAARAVVVGVVMDQVAAIHRAGSRSRDYHVGQGSQMLPLATAYDWLHADFTAEQRREVVRTLVEFCFVPTVEATFVGGPSNKKVWWIDGGFNNWTTINFGGAAGFALALRAEDDPGAIEALDETGAAVKRGVREHFEALRPVALAKMAQAYRLIGRNAGLNPEGTGYHHDTVLPLFGLVASLESVYAAEGMPADVRAFVDGAHACAGVHVHAGIQMAGATGRDWEYADGTWPLTPNPINLLVAHWAREGGSPLAGAALFRALQLAGAEDVGTRLLYMALHGPEALKGFDPATIPTGHVFHESLVEFEKGEVGINEFVVTVRQGFTAPDAAALFFKGADRRRDYHSHLDAGTFLYDALGVRWAVDVGNAAGYPYYFADGKRDWTRVTTYQTYPKRAASHNTLVINPADNAYTRREVPAPHDWYWQFNPDQCLMAGKVPPVCPVEGVEMGKELFRGSVNLYGAYQYHGARSKADGASDDPRRTFTFEHATGELTVRDRVEFERPEGNEVHWFLQVPGDAAVTLVTPTRALLSVNKQGRWRHCEVSVERAEGGKHAGMRAGKGAELLPGGQPSDDVYWGYQNAKGHRERTQKLALRMEAIGAAMEVVARLSPRSELTGLTPAEAAGRL